MAANQPARQPNPRVMRAVMAVESFLVRRFNYSLIAHMLSKASKTPAVPTAVLTTKGRKSGRWIDTPIYYFHDAGNFAVIGSKGGAPTTPVWFLNLEANPVCKFFAAGRTYDTKARLATPEERARIWTEAARQYPPYDDYAAKAAPRVIPVVILERM